MVAVTFNKLTYLLNKKYGIGTVRYRRYFSKYRIDIASGWKNQYRPSSSKNPQLDSLFSGENGEQSFNALKI
jgi:hypothetical protein